MPVRSGLRSFGRTRVTRRSEDRTGAQTQGGADAVPFPSAALVGRVVDAGDALRDHCRAAAVRGQVRTQDEPIELRDWDQLTDPTETANAEEVVVQFGYIVDVLAPAEFNEMMLSGFQTILVGDKTAEQQTADLQTAWAEGMGAVEATPSE
jgi:hypothetical protein